MLLIGCWFHSLKTTCPLGLKRATESCPAWLPAGKISPVLFLIWKNLRKVCDWPILTNHCVGETHITAPIPSNSDLIRGLGRQHKKWPLVSEHRGSEKSPGHTPGLSPIKCSTIFKASFLSSVSLEFSNNSAIFSSFFFQIHKLVSHGQLYKELLSSFPPATKWK